MADACRAAPRVRRPSARVLGRSGSHSRMIPYRHLAASLLAVFAFAALPSALQAAEIAKTEHVTARLVTEARSVEAGSTITVGIHQTIKPKWHTYWGNPGDAGVATTIAWTPASRAIGPASSRARSRRRST